MQAEAQFEIPTWNQLYKILLNQADKIRKSNFKPDIIVAISRGGWLPARILSDLLETSLAHVSVEFYIGVAQTKNEPVLTQSVSKNVAGKKTLIVDDVADTGKSLKLVEKHILQHAAKEAKIATIYYKPWSIVKPDYYGQETKLWIVFPWEIKETIRKIIEKHRNNRELIKEKTTRLAKDGLPKQLMQRFLKEIFEERTC